MIYLIQSLFDCWYCSSSCLNLVFSVRAMYGTLWADWFVTRKTEIREFIFRMLDTHNLWSSSSDIIWRWINRRNWRDRLITGGRCVRWRYFLIFITVDLWWIIIRILSADFRYASVVLIFFIIFSTLLSWFYWSINSLKFNNTWWIKLCLLLASGTDIKLKIK